MTSCSISNGITNRINSKFKIEYPKIKEYSRTKYQEKLRKRVLKKIQNDFELVKSKLYIVEVFQNRGGHHVFTKYQTVMTYFWQDGILKEVYYVNDENKLEIKKEEYWGTEHMIPTLKFIQEKMELNQFDSIEKKSQNINNQISHAGEFFITEMDEQLNIIKVLKCEEFGIE
ncbi:hypothetical protein KO506_16380 [Polaribacter vadi]|uniref:hypothetical protein n=1 Tax=Polaribacter TaxID=52959 RepID=UPI001C08C412|nr:MULTISPECIES: hypothetical protein [Polaribacter]MBU3012991.1 hypothetical protein [Polaribacter vadi]MDO6742809.1 hypothetical protein [Polaribacter sp. 1_MG-2023]